MNAINFSRRKFLRNTGVAGGGLVIGISLAGCGGGLPALRGSPGSLVPNAFLEITPENIIRFVCPRDEMGQGVTTGLTTLIAEELDVTPSRIQIALAGPHPDYDNPAFGMQATGGSTSIFAHFTQLRQVGADVRALLLRAASEDLGVPVSSLGTDDGHVLLGGARHPFGDFAATARELPLPEETPLKRASDFKYIGKDFPRLDGMDKAAGRTEFGIDVEVPGMMRAVVRRSPVIGGTVKRVNSEAAAAMPGIAHIVQIEEGIAVVSEKYWQAKQAADALDIEWSLPALADVTSAQVKADYEAAMDAEDGDATGEQGDLSAGFAAASDTVEHDYWTPYLAHAPMEPMNAVVHVEGDRAAVWCGTQGIGAARSIVAKVAGLDAEHVEAHSTYLGGGFGRRGTLTHVAEAAQISKATGKPIHLLWSREDDMKSGFFRPASLMRIKAGIDDSGQVSAWFAKRVGGNIMPDVVEQMLPFMLPNAVPDGVVNWLAGAVEGAMDGWIVDGVSVEGLFEDYDFPNREVRHVTKDHGLPLAFWRSVGHSFTAFAKETMMDELAEMSGLDAVEFRVRNTRNNPRLQNVIKAAGNHMRRMRPTAGRHLGLAAHHSYRTDVAEVAEISVENGAIRVHKVLCVVDCGLAVNPDVVRAQMEGAIMFGLTAALHGEISIDAGEVTQSNFHDYPILRMNEAPEVEVVIIDSDAHPTGVGEPGLPPIAPAVANAVYAATGKRLRSLPLKLV
ncbi:MAG: xanthine dehydrogenase family protein molybdopterin-binding subunit [Gammaproteobacteria bacterium]|nr:xanthine dehydrogenase family protein molybdopterin-binding subunit [Gammaproteobacteria bacterium]